MAAKKQHTDTEKAAALAALDANGGNVSKTAKQIGIARQTLQEWAHNHNINKDVPELRQVKKRDATRMLQTRGFASISGGRATHRSRV